MSLPDSEIEIIDKISIKDLIIEWLKKYNIKNYKINKDFTIDVNGDVNLYRYPKPQLPDYIQFNEVNGWFYIGYSEIESIKGCPIIVKGDFNCSFCSNLKTLKGAPEKVDGGFYCAGCDSLKTLEGAPEIVNGDFDCLGCSKLKTLEEAPEIVNGSFYCDHCKKLKTTESDYKKYKIIK